MRLPDLVKNARRAFAVLLSVVSVLAYPSSAVAQQFNGDNQWVAPHGVATLVGTVGEEYSQAYLIAALVPEWEFNLELTHYYEDPEDDSDSFSVANVYVKRRLSQNEAETTGYAFFLGTWHPRTMGFSGGRTIGRKALFSSCPRIA